MTVSSESSKALSEHLQFLTKLLEDRLFDIAHEAPTPLFAFSKLDSRFSKEFAKRFFSTGSFEMVGIDGSMVQEEHLEVLLFYICSLGYLCNFEVDEDGINVDIQDAERQETLTLTASVPMWMDDLSNVNPRAISASEDYEVNRSIESIANALMRLSELTLALKALERPKVKVILLDGLLSGLYGPLMRDFRLLMRGTSVLEGLDTPYGKVGRADLLLAGNLGPYLSFIPKRGAFLKCHLLEKLLQASNNGWISIDQLKLNYRNFKRAFEGLKRLDRLFNGGLIELKDVDVYVRAKPELQDFWNRVWWATCRIVERIFSKGEKYPLLLDDGRWVTVLDVSSMTLFTLYSFLNKAVEKRVLAVGVAKDTSATDFTRAFLPTIIHVHRALRDFKGPPMLQSDKAFLTMLSAIKYDRLPTPWRTLEYDYSFATMISEVREGRLDVKAARRIIGREQAFVKSYFQLRSSSLDPSMRSPVFCYDRPLYSEFDKAFLKTLEAQEYYGRIETSPFIETEGISPLGNLILYLLSISDNPNVIEESGHNHLLFLADKHVKALSKQAREMLKGVAYLGLGKMVGKYKSYFIAKRFRELRAEVERLREVRERFGIHQAF